MTMYEAMEKANVRICPICKREYSDYPAISRRDNKTEICPDCGIREAIDDYRRMHKEKNE